MIFKQLAMAAILFFKKRPKLCRDRFSIAILPNIIIWLITLKLLNLDYFVPICSSATFSTATTSSVVWKCSSIAK